MDQRNKTEQVSMLALRFLLPGLVLLLLAGCGAVQPLLSDVEVNPDTLRPTGAGETIAINYRIGQDARVSIYLLDDANERYTLRSDELRSAADDPYTLRFDGTVPTDEPGVQRRLLSSGDYSVVIEARAEDGSTSTARAPLRIAESDVPMPAIENLVAWPDTISPNADAIDDVTEITYRLPVTATVDITITTPGGQTLPFVAREREAAAEQRHVWDGKRPDGALLPEGVYTYTVTAEDRFGNIVQRQDTITLSDVGNPEATILSARIAPERVMLGDTITVTMRIRNTGDVPIRTYGPPSGYTYTTDEVYSSIEDGRYTAQAGGFWRVGLDWDANSGGGARRYPFRWALSERPPEEWRVPHEEDWLLPGEEVEVIGRVVVLQRETRMSFYVGLIQDGVGFFQDRTGRTLVEVGF
jgi:hypothetical protein